MATYPSFDQWDGTKLVARAGMVERMASNGTVRLRALQSAPKYDPTVVHGLLSDADRTTLLNFYIANRSTSFTFTAIEDGVARNCVFAAMPFQIEPVAGMSGYHKATVYLREI